ncbi:MAG: LuxR C-terminal-related transcriptional regulator [Thermomicrobiales bacterium]
MESTSRPTNPLVEPNRHTPWLAKVSSSSRLPVFLTSFIGREDEIALANALLQRPGIRLLTLTGPGGIGKTRLAVEIAAESGAQFTDGVPFVSLAPVQTPSLVMMAIAVALGLHEFDSTSVEEAVATALGTASVLLVVDNFEHVLVAAPALTRLLARCPHLKILVTSRSVLRVEGEHSIPVPPLGLPGANATMKEADWLNVPVIKLFMERAEAVDPSLRWNPSDIMRLVEICKRLDGLPLAIELAATRLRHYSLAEMSERLTDLLPLLADGSRDHPSRLQTMRNAIAWSYDLLSPEAQALLRRTAVFSGGFTLEALAGVSNSLESDPMAAGAEEPGTPTIEAGRVASIDDRLSMLIDASLLIRETGLVAGTTRYRMLETIREYAWEQLESQGEAERVQHAHAVYFTRYAVQHEIVEPVPERVSSMDRLIAEQENLRSALTWLMASPDHALFRTLVAALAPFWLAQSNYQEGKTWFDRALARRQVPASSDSARILVSLGMAELFRDERDAAKTHLAQGVTACREYGEAHGAAQGLIGLAGLAAARGDVERSMHLLGEALEAAAAIPDARLAGILAGWVSINLAVAARIAGDGRVAEEHIEAALERFQSECFPIGTMMALGDLGDLARDRGDWKRALSLYKKTLSVERTDQAKRIVTEIIESVGIVAVHSGQLDRGATLLGAAAGLRARIGLRYRQAKNRLFLDQAIETTRSGLPVKAFMAAWSSGRNLSESQAIATALDLDDRPARLQDFSLTAREQEVLRLLAMGKTDPDIATTLFISVRTVEHHVASVCRKLGVRTRTAATSTAIAAGLVPAGEAP